MGKLGKIFAGAGIGVLAIAAAPFTGGGSLFAAGVGLSGALAGAGTVAAAAGAGLACAGIGAAAASVEEDEQMEREKKARASGFSDGVNEGKAKTYSQVERFTNFYLATASLSYYIARCDGSISEEEKLEIDYDLDAIRKNCDMPDWVKKELVEIESKALAWWQVVRYLDKVGIDTLERLKNDVDEIVEADNTILPQEKAAKETFEKYLESRKKGNNVFNDGLLFS